MQGVAGGVEGPAAQGLLVQGAPFDEQFLKAGQGLAGGVQGGLGIHQAGAEAAGQAQRSLRALKIAAEPEQVVGGAAGQVSQDPADLDLVLAGHERHALHRLVVDHPDVGGPRILTHGDGAHVQAFRRAAEAAGHHLPALGRPGRVDPQDEGGRLQLAIAQHGHGGEPHHLLADKVARAVAKLGQECGPGLRGHDGDQLRP